MEIKLLDVSPETPAVTKPDPDLFDLAGLEISLANLSPAQSVRIDFANRDKQHQRIASAIFALDEELSKADKILPLISYSGQTKQELEGTKQLLLNMQTKVTQFSGTFQGFQNKNMSVGEITKLRENIRLRKRQVIEYKQEREVFRKTREDVKSVPSEIFAELWNTSSNILPVKNLATAIAMIFVKMYGQEEDEPLTEEYISSFWASAKVKNNILRLQPEDVSKLSIVWVRGFLREHQGVNYKNINEINDNVAALEPWLRTLLQIAHRVVIEMRTQEKTLEERYGLERSLQNEMSDKQSIAKHLGKIRVYKNNITKLLKAVEKSIEASTKPFEILSTRVIGDSTSSLQFIKRSSIPSIPEKQTSQTETMRRRSQEEEQKRNQEEMEIHMLARVASSKYNSKRNMNIGGALGQKTEEEEEEKRPTKKQKPPKTVPVGRRTIREFRESGTHRNNPRYRGRHVTERRRTKRGSRSSLLG